MTPLPQPNLRVTLPATLRRNDVARLLGIEASSVKRHDKTLRPFRTVGGHRRWDRDVVLDFREARRAGKQAAS